MAATFTESDSGKTVSIVVGARFTVELQENPTTGYKWARPDFDAKLLSLESDAYVLAEGTGIGGGGSHSFLFLAKACGETTIRFEYKRPWERGVAPESRFELTVVVSEKAV